MLIQNANATYLHACIGLLSFHFHFRPVRRPGSFLFIMKAAMEPSIGRPALAGQSFVPSKRAAQWARNGAEDAVLPLIYGLRCSLMTAPISSTTERNLWPMFSHLRKFGLEMHVGRGSAASKTESMYCPKPH